MLSVPSLQTVSLVVLCCCSYSGIARSLCGVTTFSPLLQPPCAVGAVEPGKV